MKVHLDACPLCYSKKFHQVIEVKDFNVSKETFPLHKCNECDIIFTNDIPNEEHIGAYYKFANYVSHTDTRESLFYKLYHMVRNVMLLVKYKWISSYVINGKKVLDIGSGTGAFLAYLRKKGWTIKGVEADSQARDNALKINKIESIQPSEFYKLSESFNVISLWHVLEHLHDLDGYLLKIKQIMQQDGVLLIAVPNPTSLEANYYKNYWDGYDVPRHLYHFSPKSMAFLADKYNFKIISNKRMWFDSVYTALLSEKHQKGLSIRGILVGLLSNLYSLFNKNRAGSITYILKHK
jgi:2-polyprenyl-3-methyl-5-hydroxy-6-metoxy-1,4-benzoquinol methylase